MLATVTNTTNTVGLPSRTINDLDHYTTLGSGPSVTDAVGGARKDALPYPFGHIGALAAAASKQLPMHPRDWRHKSVPWMTHEAGEEWQTMVQRGVVSLAFAAQTGRRDQEELFLAAV
jgi:hypothetical protein